MVQLNLCLCDWKEQPNKIEGGAKGYTLVTECDSCRISREQINADRAVAETLELKKKELEDLIEDKKRSMAIDALKLEGKLDNNSMIPGE